MDCFKLTVLTAHFLAALPFAARGESPTESVLTGPPLALAAQIDLETALQWTLQSNPNLIAARQNVRVSAEAVDVAQHFPTSLNPSVSVTYTPWVFERQANGEIQNLDRSVSVTWAQPIEIGHRQAYREQMARASYCQTRWNVLQAELVALIQTYRFHQTALYRREKLGVAQDLNTFSTRLVETLRRQAEANQATAADVVLAEVENQATVEPIGSGPAGLRQLPWLTFGSRSASPALRRSAEPSWNLSRA